MKTCLDCPHWALVLVVGGEPLGVCEVVAGFMEAGPSVPISDCPVLLLMERIEELEAELCRVAPYLALHGFSGYSMGPVVPIEEQKK